MRIISYFLSFLFIGTPAFAFAATANDGLTGDQRTQLFRSCGSAAEKVRCEARQLARWKVQAAHKPDTALATYDGMDLGKARLRTNEQQERLKTNKKEIEATRKTYSQLEWTDDANTRRRDFLNELRLRRLSCMRDAKPGAHRRQCLDALGNEMREKMKTPSSADPVLNQGKN